MRRSSLCGIALVALIVLSCFAGTASADLPWVVKNVATSFDVGEYASIAIDRQGRAHIAYYDATDGDLEYAVQSGSAWLFQTLDATGTVGQYTSIVLDAAGNPHIAYYDATNTDLKYARLVAGSWQVETVDASSEADGWYAQIALTTSQVPVIVYYDATNADLRKATGPAGSWSVITMASVGVIGLYADIAIDPNNTQHISFYDASEDRLEYFRIGTSSSLGTVISPAGEGQFSSIAADANGTPYVTYYDHTNNALKFAIRENGAFITTTVDISADVGRYSSIVLDATGRAHVSYVNSASNHIKYAVRSTSGSWSYETVDDEFNNDAYGTGIAVDPEGNPRIVHHDNSPGDLKIADSSIYLDSPNGGETWPVGSTQYISWTGEGTMDVYLSTDGGATYDLIEWDVTDPTINAGGAYELVVPHVPTKFAKIKIERSYPFDRAESDSFFTIETEIALLNFTISFAPQAGATLEWNTNPGPADLAGYRLERKRGGASADIVPFTKETTYSDPDGRPGDSYRLYAINGLGDEYFLAERSNDMPVLNGEQLAVWPTPYRGGDLSITFATASIGATAAQTRVAIYDVMGRLVREVASGRYTAGFQTVAWNGRDAGGARVASGVYFVRSESAGVVATKKFIVVR